MIDDQEVVYRIKTELRRLKIARKMKYDAQVSEKEIIECENQISLLERILGEHDILYPFPTSGDKGN